MIDPGSGDFLWPLLLVKYILSSIGLGVFIIDR